MGWGSSSGNYITVDEAKKKYGNDPYFLDALKLNTKRKWYPKFDVPSDLQGMTTFNGTRRVPMVTEGWGKNSSGNFNVAAFNEYVKERDFFNAIDDRTKTASDERASVFDREGAPPGAGADARDYSSYSAVVLGDLNKDDRDNFSSKSSQQMIDIFGSDPYFADFIAEGNRVSRSIYYGKSVASRPNYQAYYNYVNRRAVEDARAARIEAANPVIDEITQDSGGSFPLDSANTDGDVITTLTGAQIEAAFLDPNIELIQDENNNYIGYRSNQGQTQAADTTEVVDTASTLNELTNTNVTQGLSAEQIAQGYTYGDSRGSFVTPDGVVVDNPQFDANGNPIFAVADTTGVVDTTGTGTISELTGGDTATGTGAVDTTEVADTTGDGTLGQVTGTSAPGSSQGGNVYKNFVKDEVNLGYGESLSAEDVQDMQNGGGAGGVAQNPTISIAGSLYDYDGNFVGTDPNTINVGGSLYDRQGSYLGPAQVGATGETTGGASEDNVIFDAYTAEQAAAQAKAAEAVELMDAGYGRYNAAIRKLGIVGRQGEEYAPLILDQLRMAEQEAAQPQLAAFGFGLNPQLGGMPQIGVQGVQGNTGGQSALTAMSNAGLNQLQLAQQPYNRIALPAIDSATGQPDFSQVNNPTIFKASTNV